MIGFLLYLMSLPYMPHFFYVIIGLLVFISNYKIFKSFSRNNVFSLSILMVFIFGSIINMVFHIDNGLTIPYSFLHIVTFIIAYSLKQADVKIIVIFILIEAGIGIIELILGITTILPGVKSEIINNGEFWYNNRVKGLSVGVGSYSLKLLLGLLLIERFNIFTKVKLFMKLFLILAILLSFNRTVIIVAIIFELLVYSEIIINNYNTLIINKFKIKPNTFVLSVFAFIIGSVLMYFVIIKLNLLIQQFTRGTGKIELSGREVIWVDFIEYIKNNILFGNGSYKKIIPYHITETAHAHNSFIQLIANNGIVLSLVYLVFIFSRITIKNIKYVFIILLYSLTQYGVFWGISLTDIILFSFLFNETFKQDNF